MARYHNKALVLSFVLMLLLSGCGRRAVWDIPPEPADEPSTGAADTEPRQEADAFVYYFNPHVISKEYLRAYGSDIEPLFYGFCDTVLAGRESFPCPSVKIYHQLLTIARVCLPIATYCVDQDSVRVENGTGFIRYRMEHAELEQAIRAFQDKVTKVIRASVPYQEEDFVIAAELLTAVARKDSVDEAGFSMENALRLQPYRAIMDDKGICQEIAGEYIYYLLQVGINATTCSALSRDRETAHMWALVELGGEYYHIDPMFTTAYRDSLAFFGLTDAMREQYGDFPVENFAYAESGELPHEDYAADSERFKQLWRAESYTVDHVGRRLLLSLFDVYAPEETDVFSWSPAPPVPAG